MNDAPDPDLLRRFLDGELSSDEAAVVEHHIEDDPGWRAALEDASGLDQLTHEFLQPVRRTPGPDRTDAVLQLIDRLKVHPPEDTKADLWKEILTPPADPGPPGLLGTLGSYEVLEVLATGGMGVVFKARDPALDRIVALKALSPRLASNATARERFLREARSAARLEHENILPIYGVHESSLDEAVPWFAMRYVEGGSLEDHLTAHQGPLPFDELLPIARQIADALHAAHSQGIIHRDLKPSNILMESGRPSQESTGEHPGSPPGQSPVPDSQFHVYLTDFGLARATDDPSLTYPGFVAGTPQYMAPEQVEGGEVDHRADLFGLGALLYHCATGKPPFGGSTSAAVMREVAASDPEIPARLKVQLPSWFVRLIQNLLAKNPAHRFQTAAAVLDSIDKRRAPRPRRVGSRKRFFAAGILALVALAAWGLLHVPPVAHMANGVLASDARPFLNTRRLGVHDSLAAAVAAARPGDVIEVRSNRRLYVGDSIVIPPGMPLTIRAARGFLPELDIIAAESTTLRTESDLRLERLTFMRDKDVTLEPLLVVAGEATLLIKSCKIMVEGDSRRFLKSRAIVTAPGTTLELRDSLVMVSWTAAIMIRDESGLEAPAKLDLDHAHLTGFPVIGFDCDERNAVQISINRSALSGPSLFTDSPFRPLPSITVEARDSIFSSNGALWWIPEEPFPNFSARVRWNSSGSLFDRDIAFVRTARDPDQRAGAPDVATLAAWQDLPGVTSEAAVLAPLWSGMKKKAMLPVNPSDLGWKELQDVVDRFLGDFPGIGPDGRRVGPDAPGN